MFKLNTKIIATASIAAAIAVLSTGCMQDGAQPKGSSSVNGKANIDGGIIYPVINDKTGPYYVNTQSSGMKLYNGRIPTENELKAWDKDIQAGGKGLPEGSGSVEEGEEIYEAKCVMCHGDFGSGGGGYPSLSKGSGPELKETLTNNRWHDPEADGPTRVFGSYWPQLSTMWWYIKDGMPHPESKTLTDDQVYALTAYMLNINEITIDGEEIDDEFVLNKENFSKIVMPNVDGFEPSIDGPNGTDNIRKYFSNPSNFGAIKVKASERCMTDCQEKTVKVTYIKGAGISDFLPPMATARDLPKEKAKKVNPKAEYANTCAMCHSSYLSPGSDEWKPFLEEGMATVYKKGIEGTEGGMPAKGGSGLSDANFKLVVDYLVHGK